VNTDNGEDVILNIGIKCSFGHLELWMIRDDLIGRLALIEKLLDQSAFLSCLSGGHVHACAAVRKGLPVVCLSSEIVILALLIAAVTAFCTAIAGTGRAISADTLKGNKVSAVAAAGAAVPAFLIDCTGHGEIQRFGKRYRVKTDLLGNSRGIRMNGTCNLRLAQAIDDAVMNDLTI
jgi:hypothetical protein